ncbi:DUF3304 domain-containing protein [Pseudomonas aeruginosa]|uniref:DUF3304 domain-containing protein n=1 Tax=Pseudomonas aeruginosa TaxID=287 RepID=UPI001558F1F9|nr:DUF3304 domain-containing protein [Pseudomonas aeruginosa]NPW38172.1 DUF3304 domain-containing protein [Pseudomonas aeruginosa]
MLKTTCRLLLSALMAMALTGCKPADPPPAAQGDTDMVPLQVSILNYTDTYIDTVYVNGSWAGSMSAHSGGAKFAGSAEVPRQWSPDYKLTIHWRDEALYEREREALFKREVVTEPYQKDEKGRMATLWIAFFPAGVIKLYPTFVGPGNSNFPERLLAPSWECEKRFPGNSKCFAPISSQEQHAGQNRKSEAP